MNIVANHAMYDGRRACPTCYDSDSGNGNVAVVRSLSVCLCGNRTGRFRRAEQCGSERWRAMGCGLAQTDTGVGGCLGSAMLASQLANWFLDALQCRELTWRNVATIR